MRFEKKLLASCHWRGVFRLVVDISFSLSYLHEVQHILWVVPPPEIAWKWSRVEVSHFYLSSSVYGVRIC